MQGSNQDAETSPIDACAELASRQGAQDHKSRKSRAPCARLSSRKSSVMSFYPTGAGPIGSVAVMQGAKTEIGIVGSRLEVIYDDDTIRCV